MVFEVSYLKNVCKGLKNELEEPNKRFRYRVESFHTEIFASFGERSDDICCVDCDLIWVTLSYTKRFHLCKFFRAYVTQSYDSIFRVRMAILFIPRPKVHTYFVK